MTPTYLDDIVAFHRQRAAADVRDWRERVDEAVRSHPSFADAVRTSTHSNVAVIAEVKRRSPSKGWINQGLDAGALAQAYAAGGASAISVLTDGPHFGGSLDDLATVRAAVALPMLRKDFTVSANDVIDAARAGASAVLLIVAALEDDELELFTSVAKRCGLDALVEVHDEREVARAVASGATIIGINQRNLRTFEVDPRHAELATQRGEI